MAVSSRNKCNPTESADATAGSGTVPVTGVRYGSAALCNVTLRYA